MLHLLPFRRLLAVVACAPALLFAAPAFAADPPDLLGWVTLSSVNDALAIGDEVVAWTGKGGAKPSAMALPMLGQSVKALGLKDAAWLDLKRPARVLLFDAPADARESGLVLALPIGPPTQLMAAAIDPQPTTDHMMVLPVGARPLYVDSVPGYAIFTVDPTRFAKIATWLDSGVLRAKPTGAVSLGLNVRNASHAFEPEVQVALAKLDSLLNETAAKTQAGVSSELVKSTMQLYVDMIRKLVEEMETLEIFADVRAGQVALGYRATAVSGTTLEQMLTSGRGRELTPLAGALPASSYLVVLVNEDQAGKRAFFGQAVSMVTSILKLDKPGALATVADYNAMMELATGDAAMAFHVDGDAALGLLSVAGYKDGKKAADLSGRLMRQGASVLIDFLDEHEKEKASAKAGGKGKKAKGGKADKLAAVNPGQELLKLARQALKTQTLVPIVAAMNAKLPPAVRVSQSEVTEGALHCDSLTVTADWSTFPDPKVRIVQAIVGNNYNLTYCVLPNALVMAAGPNAVAQARRVAAAQAGGLGAEPSFRRALEVAPLHASQLFYLHPAPLVAALRPVLPPELAGHLADLAALPDAPTWGVGLENQTMEARLSIPASWIRWGIAYAKSSDALGATPPAAPPSGTM